MENVKATIYTHRFLARFVIEAKTPLAVGSGEKDIISDALVATDVNGLPYIPATSIAGVVRSMIGKEQTEEYFGYQRGKDGKGSEIIFTEAKIINSKGEVIDGLNINAMQDDLLKHYTDLPIRQHVRINHKGVTDRAGKFDEQVVYAGTRFCFELEMVSNGKNEDKFHNVLSQLKSKTFRIGSGTRCGFGEIDVVDLQTKTLDLSDEKQLSMYLAKSSALNTTDFWSSAFTKQEKTAGDYIEYTLELQPEDFFLFGSGFGDDDVDMTPVREKKVIWKDGKGAMSEDMVLIPASSVKGAIAHRVAFYYNKRKYRFADVPDSDPKVGKSNEAVACLFGSEGDRSGDRMEGQSRGKVLFSDIIEKRLPEKILNHVSIDRFTGGAMDGALFSEKTSYGRGESFEVKLYVEKQVEDAEMLVSLEDALKDICRAMLPLGGGVNRGNGVFTGTLKRDGETIYPNNGGSNL